MKYLPLILLIATAHAQTLYTCGSKHADPKNCMAAKLCVTSSTTHKTYCGATMAAAEAQAMSHEPQTIQASDVPLFDRDCIGNACPFDDALVCAIRGAPEEVIIPYCDQVLGTDDECVMRKGQWKQFQNDWVKQKDCAPRAGGVGLGKTCPSGEHRSLIDIPLQREGVFCTGNALNDCDMHRIIDANLVKEITPYCAEGHELGRNYWKQRNYVPQEFTDSMGNRWKLEGIKP